MPDMSSYDSIVFNTTALNVSFSSIYYTHTHLTKPNLHSDIGQLNQT